MKPIEKNARYLEMELQSLAKDILEKEGKVPFNSQMVRDKCVELKKGFVKTN